MGLTKSTSYSHKAYTSFANSSLVSFNVRRFIHDGDLSFIKSDVNIPGFSDRRATVVHSVLFNPRAFSISRHVVRSGCCVRVLFVAFQDYLRKYFIKLKVHKISDKDSVAKSPVAFNRNRNEKNVNL